MAELPVFQRRVSLPGDPLAGARVRPSDTAAGQIAGALQTAAAGAAELHGVLDEIQKSKESAWITRATGEAEIWAAETERRLESESTEGAPGHVDAFRGEWSRYRDGLLRAAPSRRSRDALSARLSGVESSAVRRRGAFQAQAELTKRGADLNIGLNAHVFAIQQDPGRIGEIMGRLRGDLDAAAAWMPADALTATRTNAFSAIAAAAVEGFIDKEDFVMARLVAEGDEIGSMMEANQRAALIRKIEEAEKGVFVRDEGRAIGEAMSSATPFVNENGAATPELVAAITHVESKGKANAKSPAGAVGVMQLMPDTAKEMAAELGIEYDAAKLTDPTYNTALGTAYINKMLAQYDGNVLLALAAYNAGPKRVNNWIKRFGDPRTGAISNDEWRQSIPFSETRDYIDQIEERMGGAVASSDEILSAGVQDIVDPALRDRVIREANTVFALNSSERERVKASEEMEKAKRLAALEVAVSRNQAGYEDIDAAFADGSISPSEWSRLTRAKDSAIEAEKRQSADLTSARARLAAGGAFNVFESEDRKAVDLLYEASDKSAEAAMALAAATNIVPGAVVSDLQLRMRQGDVSAFELAENLSRAAPQGFAAGDGGKAVTERVDEFQGLVRAGYTTQEAARRAARSDRERAESAPIIAEARKEFGKVDVSDMLGELEADGWGVDLDPARHGRLALDFETAYMQARLDGNDHDDAMAIAGQRLDRIWGYTEVNGNADEVMRFPPERFYPAGPDGHGYIRQQAVDRLTARDGAAPTRLRFMSDIQTEADIRAGILPRYKLFYWDKDGVFQEVIGYYRPDPSGAMEASRILNRFEFEERRKAIERANEAARRAGLVEPFAP